MNDFDILTLVESYIQQSRESSLSKENNKFDFKREWYNLREEKSINEFLKDTTAIANTFGLDGFIVIGFDEKSGEIQNSKFSDSGIDDPSKIYDLINKRVDRLFRIEIRDLFFENKSISVIHIPPSLDKPHVIRRFLKFDKKGNERIENNRIFVRTSTSTHPASKYDIELMFYDRKNIQLEYEAFIGLSDLNASDKTLALLMNIENTGRRSITISNITFSIEWRNKEYNFHSKAYINLQEDSNNSFSHKPITIPPNKTITVHITFSIQNNTFEYSKIKNELINNKSELNFSLFQFILGAGKEIHVNATKLFKNF